MELLLGTRVHEMGTPLGLLAGFELDPATLLVHRIIFSQNGELGPQDIRRPLGAVLRIVHDGGEIDLRPEVEQTAPMPNAISLSRTTHIRENDREIGRLVGIDVEPGDQAMVAALGRRHWWSRRFSMAASAIDFSTPGEIRSKLSGSRAA